MKKSICLLLIPACWIMLSCGNLNNFEKNISIPDHSWSSQYKPRIQFTISDSTALYKLFVVIRHTDAYHYNNIWLNIGLQPPGDTMHYSRFDLLLATDADGWLGKGMDDIYEQRVPITDEPVKLKNGDYTVSLENIMREDPLAEVLNIGFRVEKLQP